MRTDADDLSRVRDPALELLLLSHPATLTYGATIAARGSGVVDAEGPSRTAIMTAVARALHKEEPRRGCSMTISGSVVRSV